MSTTQEEIGYQSESTIDNPPRYEKEETTDSTEDHRTPDGEYQASSVTHLNGSLFTKTRDKSGENQPSNGKAVQLEMKEVKEKEVQNESQPSMTRSVEAKLTISFKPEGLPESTYKINFKCAAEYVSKLLLEKVTNRRILNVIEAACDLPEDWQERLWQRQLDLELAKQNPIKKEEQEILAQGTTPSLLAEQQADEEEYIKKFRSKMGSNGTDIEPAEEVEASEFHEEQGETKIIELDEEIEHVDTVEHEDYVPSEDSDLTDHPY